MERAAPIQIPHVGTLELTLAASIVAVVSAESPTAMSSKSPIALPMRAAQDEDEICIRKAGCILRRMISCEPYPLSEEPGIKRICSSTPWLSSLT